MNYNTSIKLMLDLFYITNVPRLFKKVTVEPGMVVHACHSSYLGAEAGGS
jgi:hypothetical protein